MQISELMAVGAVAEQPTLEQTEGRPCCKFVLRVEAPGKQRPNIQEIHCTILGGNAAHCWGSVRPGDEMTVWGVPFVESFLDESGKPRGRQCVRCNFIRYSQDVLNRIEENKGK